jgi:predicted RNA-binding protein with PIN domain
LPVLIDGNNLLHAANAVGKSPLLLGRSMLCDIIGNWALRRRERVHIVFDGPAPSGALAQQIGHPAIEVTYSGAGVSADSAIERLLGADSAARRLIVVSSDRAVAQAARRRLARPLRSDEFWLNVERDRFRPRPSPGEPEEKLAGSDPEATEQWLEEFGLD